MQDVRLYISVPSNRDWKGRFGACWGCLIGNLAMRLTSGKPDTAMLSENHRLTYMHLNALGQASCLSTTRQLFVDEILAGDYTHWLSLDDDMTFPADIVERLIKHDKDVVAVNALRKQAVHEGTLIGLDGNTVESRGKTGLEEIKFFGGAIFLAKVSAFRNIPRPHFQVLWSDQKQKYISEDIYFAAAVRGFGAIPYCDHDTTKLIGHIGDYEYRYPAETPKQQAPAMVGLTPEQIAALGVVA